jgi:hypothetical protein
MQANQIRRLVALNRDQRLVGIVSLGDLAVGTADEKLAAQTLEQVSQPASPKTHERPTTPASPEPAHPLPGDPEAPALPAVEQDQPGGSSTGCTTFSQRSRK